MKFRTAASLLLSLALAGAALGQDRPTAPRPRAPGRPGGPPARGPGGNPGGNSGGNAPRAVTQPDGHGALPVIPYDDGENALNFQDASSDLVIMEYCVRTGRTPLPAANVPKVTITLRTTPDCVLTDEEYLRAIREVLSLNGIVLKEEGEKFVRVLPAAEAATHAFSSEYPDDNGGFPDGEEDGRIVQRMVELKHITTEEALPIVNSLMRPSAKVLTIEHNNAILITDALENINRIIDVLQRMDKPAVAREEPFFRQIRFAKAADIKARLEEAITQAQEQENSSGARATTVPQTASSGPPGVQRRQLPPGVTYRGPRGPEAAENAAPATPEAAASLMADAAKGILRGKVAIVVDERTNRLLILTRPENMVFLDRIIEEFDIPVAPEYLVEVHRLENAVAKDVATLLNDMLGKQKSSDSDARRGARGDGGSSGGENAPAGGAPRPARAGAAQRASGESRTLIGQIDAENVSILPDERSNSLLITASAADMAMLRDLVSKLDIRLSQVVIETVIVGVTFKDSDESGMDWAQRAMLDSGGRNGPGMAWATAGGGGSGRPVPATSLTTADAVRSATGGAGGVNAIVSVFDLNLDLFFKFISQDSKARLMSSPRITTMDNTEATLEATERIYWKGETTHYASSDYTSENIKNEDIGIKLTVTPRINKKSFITLTVEQEIQSCDGYTEINGSQYPQLSTRKMGADLAVQSGETIVLGGLAQNSITRSTTKVPLLGDIPLLGWFFRHEAEEHTRAEILVFLTPRVIDTPAQIEDDARNARASIDTAGVWDPAWSGSRMADPLTEEHAEDVLSNGRATIAPARFPLTGPLTPLNEEAGFAPEDVPETIRAELDRARAAGELPYVHSSDVDRSATPPDGESGPTDSTPDEPPPAPVADEVDPIDAILNAR